MFKAPLINFHFIGEHRNLVRYSIKLSGKIGQFCINGNIQNFLEDNAFPISSTLQLVSDVIIFNISKEARL